MTNSIEDSKPLNRFITWSKHLLPFLVAFILLIITQFFSSSAFSIADVIYPKWQQLDPDGSFLYISIHHVFQALFAVVFIALIRTSMNSSWSDFGFNTNQWRFAIKRVLQFCLFWFILQGSMAVFIILSGNSPVPFNFPLTVQNFLGYFLFQVLLSGTSEEILFRAMVIFPMLYVGKRAGLSEKSNSIIAVVVSILIFMIAHIKISFNPFEISNFILMQQITVITFGAFYAYLLLKTKSLIGPILAHNWLNGIIVLVGLLVIQLF